MTTKTVNLYTFDELSDKAKEKAREWWRACEGQDFGSYGDLNEPIETAAKLLGIELKTREVPLVSGKTRSEPCVWWQLHSQGSGASFEGTYAYRKGSVKAIAGEFPEDAELIRIARELSKLQKQYAYKLTATIGINGRSVHQYAMDTEAFDASGEEAFASTEINHVAELMRDFATWIYKYISAEWDYRMSDENVDDSIIANEYTFLADGKREN